MAGIVVLDASAIALSSTQSPLSGSVLVDGVGVSRRILIYKNTDNYASVDIVSEADGTWSAEVNGTSNDRFRVVIVGQNDEYTKAFANVVVG